MPSLLQKESTVTSLESEGHEVAQSSNAPKSVSDTVTADQSSNCQAQDGDTGVSARPPRFQHLSDAQCKSLLLTAGECSCGQCKALLRIQVSGMPLPSWIRFNLGVGRISVICEHGCRRKLVRTKSHSLPRFKYLNLLLLTKIMFLFLPS